MNSVGELKVIKVVRVGEQRDGCKGVIAGGVAGAAVATPPSLPACSGERELISNTCSHSTLPTKTRQNQQSGQCVPSQLLRSLVPPRFSSSQLPARDSLRSSPPSFVCPHLVSPGCTPRTPAQPAPFPAPSAGDLQHCHLGFVRFCFSLLSRTGVVYLFIYFSDWAMAAIGSNPQLSFNLPLFSRYSRSSRKRSTTPLRELTQPGGGPGARRSILWSSAPWLPTVGGTTTNCTQEEAVRRNQRPPRPGPALALP